MKNLHVLFVSRKSATSIGGLARFFQGLSSHFLDASRLTPQSVGSLFTLPFGSIDLIHLSDATLLPIGVVLKFFMRKPFTLTAHGLDITYPNIFYQRMLKNFLPHTSAIILDSDAARGSLTRLGVTRDKIVVVNPGISILHFAHPTRIKLPDIEGKTILLTVGNLVSRKGHMWFIQKVFSRLPHNFVYLIVGDGPEKDKVKTVIKKLHLEKRIFLLGRLSDSKLAFVFGKADIYVCPNQKVRGDFEGFGIAAGEAAAMGLPVVASDVDGISEVIQNGKNGWLVEPKVQAFIAAFEKLKDPIIRRQLGKEARAYTKRQYNWQKSTAKYAAVFENIL